MKSPRSCFLLVACAALLPCAGFAQSASAAQSNKPIEFRASYPDNFDRVSPTLFRGSAPDAQDFANLKKLGVKSIVDLRMHGSKKEAKLARQNGFQYFHEPMGYLGPSQKQLDAILSVIRDPANSPVYLHCRQGADRTGMLIGMYRIIVDKWPFSRAYSEMRAHHFKPFLFALKERVETCAEHQQLAAQ